ncbi:hypothetical protein KQX54_012068 [Cotesia glomerata]|uniref:Uncharacterized protein n=1 Tax=Cotesia glomerata TaxID=32391 RepID=A0AAV7J856_COTGL|nr:hypothetical protein KQX54_012068 [Cotesia glomerata]
MVNGPPTGPSPLEQRDRLVGTNGVSKVPSNNTFKKHYPDRETDTNTVIIVDCDSGGGDSVDKFNTNSLLERKLSLGLSRWPCHSKFITKTVRADKRMREKDKSLENHWLPGSKEISYRFRVFCDT